MRLRPSDLYAQLLRPVGVCGAEFAFSDVRTEHTVLLRFYDTFSASDSAVTSLTSLFYDTFSASDSAVTGLTSLFLEQAGGAAYGDGVVSDSVVVSLWSLTDCSFGGLSFGGSPFGGRIV